ncbi:MAG: hypothetical protein R2737_02915 [Candidatus Nanopelagicales bacterium]
MDSTLVTYPSGAVDGTGTVVAVVPLDGGRVGVVTDTTPFHPVDHTWPDQPGDVGSLAARPVVDCVTGAVSPDGNVLVGADIPVRRGEEGWSWVVVHVLDDSATAPAVGDAVSLTVDGPSRAALSAGHTACHLAAFALNAEVAGMWRKDPGRSDSLGHPDFDQLALTESRILPDGAFDAYRLGKSLRKKGFESADLLAQVADVQDRVNARLAAWLSDGAEVRVLSDGDDTVTARRQWSCDLAEGSASVPCGGTHVSSLADLAAVSVDYRVTDDGTGLEVRTTAVRA